MTFDIEAMRRNRDAGTPGPWSVFINDAGDAWTGWPISINCDVIDDKTIVRTGGMWPYDWDAKTSQHEACANAAHIASIPSMEAEIERLTARVAELEGAISYIADGFCLDAPAFASPIFEDDDSLEDSEWIFEVIRATLSTPTEEPKT